MYVAQLIPKKKLFQKAYIIDENTVYVTNTKRSKKKFLKSGIGNIIFGEEFRRDELIGEQLVPVYCYNADFIINYLDDMILNLISFLKIKIPCDEIAVFSDREDIISTACKYTRMVSVIGFDGSDGIKDGVQIRHVKKFKTPPCFAITMQQGNVSPLLNVPCVNLGEHIINSGVVSNWHTISFTCDILPFEISAAGLMFFLEKGMDLSYRVTSFRKKSPALYTFG